MNSPSIDPTAVADRIHDLEERLANLSGGRTRLLPVTKAFGPEAVKAVLAAGHSAVGENYAQEILAKDDALAGWDVAWHVIGSVQRNKVRRLA
ncbi:MAG: YggS family pyridoxal phosphate enzyme, partial [Actinomycetota bacterium]|nr:YggS family pyridoxal phosphate enzyme [Actinomycetota bacterium]